MGDDIAELHNMSFVTIWWQNMSSVTYKSGEMVVAEQG